MSHDFDKLNNLHFNLREVLEKPQEDNLEHTHKDTFYKDEFMKELKLMDHSVQSPTNFQAQQHVTSNQQHDDSQFEIMNSRAKGIDQLFHEEDRNKLKLLNEELRFNLDDMTNEDNDKYGYISGRGVSKFAFNLGEEIKVFNQKLFEKKRKGGLLEHTELSNPGETKDVLGNSYYLSMIEIGPTISKKDEVDSKDELTMKLDWVRMRRKINSISDIHPLTLNMDTIFNLPNDLVVLEEGEERGTRSMIEIMEEQRQRIEELKEEIGREQVESSLNEMKKMETYIENLLNDEMEFESVVNLRENAIPTQSLSGQLNPFISAGATDKPSTNIDPSHNSLNFLESVELPEPNFFRDLCPFTRKFAKPKKEEERVRREIQKKILHQFIEIEPLQQNINEEMYLLAISGIVPVDKLVLRMKNLNKWDVRDESMLESTSEDEEGSQDETYQNMSPVGTVEQPTTVERKSLYSDVNHDKINMNIKQLRRETYQTDDYSDGQFFEEQRERNLTEKQPEHPKKYLNIEPIKSHSRQPHFTQLNTELPPKQQPLPLRERSESSGERTLEKLRRAMERQTVQHDLSVISEIQQSVGGESIVTKELLRSFNKMPKESGINSFNPNSLENSQQIQLRIKRGDQYEASNERPIRVNQIIKIDENPSIRQLEQLSINIPNYEQQIYDHLVQVEQLISAKRQLESEQKSLANFKKNNQNLKNLERMRLELNKRIESHLLEIVTLLDMNAQVRPEEEYYGEESQVISTEIILKGSALQNEDIDEALKAKFLSRLVREYRRNREKAKQESLKENMEKEIENNIYNRFPSLGSSPERTQSNPRSGSRGANSTMRSKNQWNSKVILLGKQQSQSPPSHPMPNPYQKALKEVSVFEIEEVTKMKKGWGVGNISVQHNTTRQKIINQPIYQSSAQKVKQTPQSSQHSQHSLKPPPNSKKVNHFRQKKKPSMAEQDIQEVMPPRKQPMREKIIKYTPSTALMNNKKHTGPNMILKGKATKRQQDLPPDDEWIGSENVSDFEDQQWAAAAHSQVYIQ